MFGSEVVSGPPKKRQTLSRTPTTVATPKVAASIARITPNVSGLVAAGRERRVAFAACTPDDVFESDGDELPPDVEACAPSPSPAREAAAEPPPPSPEAAASPPPSPEVAAAPPSSPEASPEAAASPSSEPDTEEEDEARYWVWRHRADVRDFIEAELRGEA